MREGDLLLVCVRLVVEDEEERVEFHLGHFLCQMLVDHGGVRFLRVVVWRRVRVLWAIVVWSKRGSVGITLQTRLDLP